MIEWIANMLQTSNPMLVLLMGLAIGAVHAFEPDHVAAMASRITRKNHDGPGSTQSSIQKTTRQTSVMGMFWGAGHASSTLIMGTLVAVFSLSIPNSVFAGMEIIAGLMLVLLGVLLIFDKNIARNRHTHPHKHADGTVHTHMHNHENRHRHAHGSYIIGCIHGFAGGGIVVALLASSLESADMMFYFLVLFGIGSVIGMVATSGIIGIPFMMLPKKRHVQRLRRIIALVTIMIGIIMIYQMVFLKGFLV